MVLIKYPHCCSKEYKYILKIIFTEFLGIKYESIEFNQEWVEIEENSKKLILPNIFFNIANNNWLKESTLPPLPLSVLDTQKLPFDLELTDNLIPIIFGQGDCNINGKQIRLDIDIFGSAFFMLSRYEELVKSDRDDHDRFPAEASLAYKAGFLDRPIVDEYLEILWSAMSMLWPGLKRKQHKPLTFVSCDLDTPYLCYSKSLALTARTMIGDLLKRHSPGDALRDLSRYWLMRHGDYSNDPNMSAIDYILDVNEAAGNKVTFNFIAERLHAVYDGCYSLNESVIRNLLRHVHSRGHEIGLHASYNSYNNKEQLRQEMLILCTVMAEEGIEQAEIGGRQHYLRWAPETAINLEAAGLAYDSTLSFADHSGFRCGTCCEYPMYDLLRRRSLKLRQRPLVLMECSVIDQEYMGMGYRPQALAYMKMIKQRCRQFNGGFTLLWHNSHLNSSAEKEFYWEMIK